MSNGIRPNGPHLPLYRRLRFGNLIDLNVLDTRQYRSDKVTICGGAARTAATRVVQAGTPGSLVS